MEINQTAPVTATDGTHIDAPVEMTWHILADIENWPQWNPAVSRVDLATPIVQDSEFRWKADGTTINSRMEEILPPHRLVWSGRTLGIRAVHVWKFETRDGGTYVTTEESFEGLVARLLARPLRKMLSKSLRQGLSALKAEAERQALRVT